MGKGIMQDSRNIPLYLIATLSTILILYNFIAVCCWSRPPPAEPNDSTEEENENENENENEGNDTKVVNMATTSHKFCKIGTSVGECVVCLGEFEEGEELRALPECSHTFHAECVDLWLLNRPNCPVCRADQLTIA